MKAHPLDIAHQAVSPTVMVPLYGELTPLNKNGHRFLAACNGLWVEVRRPWLHLVWPLATQQEFPMPYGKVEKKTELTFGKIPVDLIAQFVADAEAAFPNEFGAWLVWDDYAKQLNYRAMRSIDAGPGHLVAERPEIAEHESLAVNLHSHGRYPAFFSPDDDIDDRHEVKVAGVFGSFGGEKMTTAFRICTGGGFINLGDQELGPMVQV